MRIYVNVKGRWTVLNVYCNVDSAIASNSFSAFAYVCSVLGFPKDFLSRVCILHPVYCNQLLYWSPTDMVVR